MTAGAGGKPVRRIGFAYNPTNDAAVELRERAAGWGQMRGLDHWAAPAADREALHRELPGTDILVVLGGDGTFLRAARAVIEDDVPLLGINVGKVGFLSKVEASELERVLEQLVEGRFDVEPRMALEGHIFRGGSKVEGERLLALNDVVIARGSLARVVRLDTSIDSSHWRRSSPTAWSSPAPRAPRATPSPPVGRSWDRRRATSWSHRSPAT